RKPMPSWRSCCAAQQLRHEGIGFRKDDNLFLACEAPQRLQEWADAFSPEVIQTAVEPWLARWLPYFSPAEQARGYRHRLYLAQVEYCHNLIFHRSAALD